MLNSSFKKAYIDLSKENPQSKEGMFKYIASFIAKQLNVDAKQLEAALLFRESESNTNVGDGIAIPHAITNCVDTSSVFLFLPENKVDWYAYDKRAVDIIFVLIVPKEKYDVTHLRQISLLARELVNQEFQTFLRKEKNIDVLYQKVLEIQEEQ